MRTMWCINQRSQRRPRRSHAARIQQYRRLRLTAVAVDIQTYDNHLSSIANFNGNIDD